MITDIGKYCVNQSTTILGALRLLDTLSNDVLVLFVIDDNWQMVGTATDGDIRRALIKGVKLEDKISSAMKKNYSYISTSEKDITSKIKLWRTMNISLVPLIDSNRHILKIYNFSELKSILPVDAVLMAGGKGERLRPLTEKTPKPLLPIGRKVIIDHNVDRLLSFGLEHIFVTVNYLKEQIQSHFAEPYNGIQIQTISEPEYLGTMGSIKFISYFYNETVLLMNSDLFTDIDFEDFYLHFKEHNADMSVAAVPYTVSVPYGIMDLDGRNIKGMIEKPRYNYYANAGIYLFKREILDMIPRGKFYNATDLIDDLIRQNKNVIRYPINGMWIDIGNPQEYQKARDLVEHMK